jgi:alpha-tubulin suppressor-like RCC1 family protein
VFTWGLNKDGQLGHGDNHNLTTPAVVGALEGTAVVKVAAGAGHSAFVAENGVLFMCGRGRSGQLGRGDQLESLAAQRTLPVEVAFFKTSQNDIVDIALGPEPEPEPYNPITL